MRGFTWRIGGPQGAGVDSAAQVLARGFALSGRFVALRREYHSNIMGRHSYADVRVAERAVPGFFERVELLAATEGETLARHLGEVRPGGVLLYNADETDKKTGELVFLDPPARARVEGRFGGEVRLGRLVEAYAEEGVRVVPVPAREVLKAAGADSKSLSLLFAAVSARLLGLELPHFLEALARVFSGKERVVAAGRRLAELAYERFEPAFTPPPGGERGERAFMNGSHAAALGRVAAGLGFMSYYPITPATDEPFFLEAHPEAEVTVVQVEDELSAVNMAIGAAFAGVPAALTTSGPGFSLMAEALSFAGLAEVPLVVALYQRAGPSTGLPTRHEQGDLLFSLFAGHGEFPRVVLASGSLEEVYRDAALALELAWRFQLPVIHLLDKHLAQSFKTLPLPLPKVPEARPKAGEPAPAFPRYRLSEDGVSPFLPVGERGGYYWVTSDEHDEHGHITEDPELRVRMMDKRLSKEKAVREYLKDGLAYEVFRPEAPAVVVGWGSVKEAALAALEEVPELGYLHLRLLSPFPELGEVLADKRVAVLEQNATGQLARLLPGRPETLILKYNGRPMTIEEVTEAFSAFARGEAGPRVVLKKGV